MLPSNGKYCVPEYDYHITNDEVGILLRYVEKHYSKRYYLLFCLVWSRGLRISEALFVNFRDFPLRGHGDFSKFNFREAKTNKERQNEIIVEPVAEMIRDYFLSNPLLFITGEGYLFYKHKGPRHRNAPVLKTETAGSFFAKWRKELSIRHPQFLDKYPHKNYYCKDCEYKVTEKQRYEDNTGDCCPKCNNLLKERTFWRYRCSWHSLRRNFEDNGLKHSDDNVYFVKELMGYHDIKVVDHYVSKKRLKEKVPDFMDNCIVPLFNKFQKYNPDQAKLSQFS